MEDLMTLAEVTKILNATIVSGQQFKDREMTYVFASDLMSDVLTVSSHNLLLVTGLCNIQTIRASEMSDISNIVFVRGKKVTPEMIKIAEENQIALIECDYSMFKTSGLLFDAGLKPLY
jgi:predicted transcriptional regulator